MIIIIPTILITIITFPGIIIHEIAHRLFCDKFGLMVYKVKYFLPSNIVSGYVEYEPTTNVIEQYLITIAPFIINTLVCAFFTLPSLLPLDWFGDHLEQSEGVQLLFIIMAWIGFSSGMHAFPSSTDLEVLENVYLSYPPESKMVNLVIRYTASFFWMINSIRFFLIEFGYALLISKIFPLLLSY